MVGTSNLGAVMVGAPVQKPSEYKIPQIECDLILIKSPLW
ncbi:MAG: hypothetical protein ACJARR_001330 [Pseudophaeobacter arcticus]|jgi:hypothetical protein